MEAGSIWKIWPIIWVPSTFLLVALYLPPLFWKVRLAYDFYLELHVKSESLSKRPVSIHKHHIFDSNLIILQIELHIIAAESGVYLVCQTF